MNFIDQVLQEQIVPERAAAKNQNVFALLAFELGNLIVSFCAADDASRVLPGLGLLGGQAVLNHNFVNGVIEP